MPYSLLSQVFCLKSWSSELSALQICLPSRSTDSKWHALASFLLNFVLVVVESFFQLPIAKIKNEHRGEPTPLAQAASQLSSLEHYLPGMQLDRRKNLVGFSESSPSVELGLDILNIINQRTGLEPATKGFQLARSFYIWSIEKNTRYDFSMLKTYSVFFFTEFTNVFPSASPFPSGMLSFFFPIMFCHQIDSFFLRVMWL